MTPCLALPTLRDVLKKIAAADGRLPNHPDYLTKYQMIELAQYILRVRPR